MKIAQIHIVGINIRRIIGLVTEGIEDYHHYFAGEVEILFREDWSSSMESSQIMSSYIFHFNGDREVKIEVVTGGAKDNLLFDWNAENGANKKVFRKIKAACEDNGWTITKVSPPELENPFFIEKLLGVTKGKQSAASLGDVITEKMESIFFGKHDDKK